MFADFDEIFKKEDDSHFDIPPALVEYINKSLPKGTKYVVDNDNLVITADDGSDSINIGGFVVELTKEQKRIIGKEYNLDDVLSYSYNAQKPIQLKPKKDGFLLLNGAEFPIEKLSYNPIDHMKYEQGTFYMIPYSFPEPFEIVIGCDEYSKIISIQRVPNESVTNMAFESDQNSLLRVKYYLDEKSKKFTMNMSLNFKSAKSFYEIVESVTIFNAFMTGKGKFGGIEFKSKIGKSNGKKFDEKSIDFYNKVVQIEKALNVTFKPPRDNIDFDTICLVEQLFQNLINKNPTRDKQVVNTLTGKWGKNEQINESIGKPIYFEYEASYKLDLFDVKLDMVALLGVFNAVFKEYKTNKNNSTILLDDENPEKKRYTSVIVFKDINDLNEFKKIENNERINKMREAKRIVEYLE